MRSDRGKSARLDWLREHMNHTGKNCLIWPFSYARGYGNLGFDGRITYAHRVMCVLTHGDPPSPAHQAAHDCGNSRCVNPRHIKWKTPSANQLDKRVHGGLNRNGRRKKLTLSQAIAIRRDTDHTHDELAKMYGTCRRNIGAIKDGKSWRDAVGQLVQHTQYAGQHQERQIKHQPDSGEQYVENDADKHQIDKSALDPAHRFACTNSCNRMSAAKAAKE